MLRRLTLILSLSLVASSALADGATCSLASANKKLAGAAKASFLKKCEKDAAVTCQAASKEKMLYGAAKASFEKKCVKDAVR